MTLAPSSLEPAVPDWSGPVQVIFLGQNPWFWHNDPQIQTDCKPIFANYNQLKP
jgi:hypothetical protein